MPTILSIDRLETTSFNAMWLVTNATRIFGDTITITMTNVEKRAGGKTLKHFEVEVGKGTAPAPAAAAPAAADPAATLAASGLTPEQIEAAKQLFA